MKDKLKKIGGQLNEAVTVVLVAAVLVVVNYLFTLFPLRWDVTANQRYSLSSGSKNIINNVDDLVKIKVFVSEKLPPQYQPLVQQVRDLLWEYEQSSSKVNVEYLDPSDNSGVAQQARSLGIYPVQFSDFSQGKVEVSEGYFGLVVLYGGESEGISFIEDSSNLEYQITLAISNLAKEEKSEIGFITGHQEKDTDENMSTAVSRLQKQFSIETTELETLFAQDEEGLPQTLIAVGPQSPLGDKEKFYLDQFLMRGKGALLMVEGVKVKEGLQAESAGHQWGDFLSHYGVSLNTDLVLDASNEVASFSDGRNTFFINYPFWPLIRPAGFQTESPVTSYLESALFPWVSSLELADDGDNKTLTSLVQTSPQSWRQTENYNLNPTQEFIPPKEPSSQTVAALVEGSCLSYFTDRDQPSEVELAEVKGKTESLRLMVVGDADFATDRYLQGTPSNYTLLANMVDYLSAETSLTSIRSKGQTFRPLKNLSESAQAQIKYANMLGPSGLLLVGGFLYMYRRKQ